jgi:hypothetical protein
MIVLPQDFNHDSFTNDTARGACLAAIGWIAATTTTENAVTSEHLRKDLAKLADALRKPGDAIPYAFQPLQPTKLYDANGKSCGFLHRDGKSATVIMDKQKAPVLNGDGDVEVFDAAGRILGAVKIDGFHAR